MKQHAKSAHGGRYFSSKTPEQGHGRSKSHKRQVSENKISGQVKLVQDQGLIYVGKKTENNLVPKKLRKHRKFQKLLHLWERYKSNNYGKSLLRDLEKAYTWLQNAVTAYWKKMDELDARQYA